MLPYLRVLSNLLHPSPLIWSMLEHPAMRWMVMAGLLMQHLISCHPFFLWKLDNLVHLPVDINSQIGYCLLTFTPTSREDFGAEGILQGFYVKQTSWKNTILIASLAARWSISAQETIPGHRDSRTVLILSINTNPPSPRFCGALFSGFGPSSSSIDASQPYATSWFKIQEK